jgi:hypothetical protein
MARPILVALVAVIAVMVVSWMLGEFLRQRGDRSQRKPGHRRHRRH